MVSPRKGIAIAVKGIAVVALCVLTLSVWPSKWMLSSSTSIFDADTARRPRHLLHDFGLVQPGQHKHHVFEIHNDTNIKWTVQEIRASCSCTVLTPKSDVVLPGTTMPFRLVYKAPSTPADDRRSAPVLFEESAAPIVTFDMTARVRDKINAWPTKLVVRTKRDQPVGCAELVVETFGADLTNCHSPSCYWISPTQWQFQSR
jgi:hypothetical protein